MDLEKILRKLTDVLRLDMIDTTKIHEIFDKTLVMTEDLIKHTLESLPVIEKFCVDAIDTMFAPKQLVRQAIMIVALQLTLIGMNTTHRLFTYLYQRFTQRGREEKKLLDELKKATSYDEWRISAAKLDKFRGMDEWINNPASTVYDYKLVQRRIQGTKEMLDRGDVFDLMFRIRGALSRDQFGIQHERLFTRALSGTKRLVENYHDTMARALNFICDSPIADEEIPTDAKLAFFNETRHAYGRTALLLSGGAYLGYYHMGVLRALFEEGLLPRVMSGASAGSIMAAVVGTKTDQELRDLYDSTEGNRLPAALRTDFFRYSHELRSEMARRINFLLPEGLRWVFHPLLSSLFDKKILNLDTEHFKKCLMFNCGLYTFQEAFDRTGRIINIIVAPLNHYDPPRLLNYLTAPHVCVWSAAAASCAIPGIFDSITLIVKEPNGQYRPEHEWTRTALFDSEEGKNVKLSMYSDGSLENDLPMEQLSELFNVNHFIVSQVNPHSALLSSLQFKQRSNTSFIYNALVAYLGFVGAQCRDWLKNIVNFLMFRANAPSWSAKRGLTQTLTQEYEGRENDVTIMPWAGHISTVTALTSAIKNPNGEEYCEISRAAEANTWPVIARIRAHCLIETTLDQCVQRLRKRITEESEMNRERMLKNVLKHVATSTGRPQQLDRTPSFYTTRSIVNLSGLSVSDPVPNPKRIPSHGTLSALPAETPAASHRARRRSRDHHVEASTTTVETHDESTDDADLSEPIPLQKVPSNVPKTRSFREASRGSHPSVVHQNTPAPTGLNKVFHSVNSSENLEKRRRSGSFSYHLEDLDSEEEEDDPQLVTFDVIQQVPIEKYEEPWNPHAALPGLLHASKSSEDNLKEKVMQKTTNMANFYYKRQGQSRDNLKEHFDEQLRLSNTDLSHVTQTLDSKDI